MRVLAQVSRGDVNGVFFSGQSQQRACSRPTCVPFSDISSVVMNIVPLVSAVTGTVVLTERSAICVRSPSAASATEYGSVTSTVSTRRVHGQYTVTRYL